jgi:serine/threonine-protein kinase
MEYLEGRSLARELAGRRPLDPGRAIDIACQIARGLSAAHQAGVIHRDLKPDNVFLIPADQHGPEQAKILDFGIAHVSNSKTRLTAAGAVVGTPEYMSPEQARGSDLDSRSDLYALGIVLFEMLTGRVPLTAESSVGTLTKQVYELPPRLRDVNPAIGDLPSIEAAIGRLLAKNRDERPASALDAARLVQTAGVSDLESSDDPRARAALDGWSRPSNLPPVSERDLARRSTIMIGSGSVTRAHEGEPDQPATGSFSAKPVDPDSLSKRPSVIVKDGVSTMRRPAPPEPPRSMAPEDPYSATPTPDSNPRIGKPPRPGIARYLPFILLGIGAAIFAALVTFGLVKWLQKRERRTSDATDVVPHADFERVRSA